MSIYNYHYLNEGIFDEILLNFLDEKPPILKLPQEIISNIEHHLSLKDILAMRKTCTYWNQFINMDIFIKKSCEENRLFGLHHFIYRSQGYPIGEFAKVFFNYATVKQQGRFLAALSIYQANVMLQSAPEDLSCLKFDLSGKSLNSKEVSDTSLLCQAKQKKLEQLAYFIYVKFGSLQELSLVGSRVRTRSVDLLQAFYPCFNHLSKLSLNLFISSSNVTDKVLQSMQKLRELKINCYGLKDLTLYKILKCAKELRDLYFIGWSSRREFREHGSYESLSYLKIEKIFIKLSKKKSHSQGSNRPEIKPVADEKAFNMPKFLIVHAWLLSSLSHLQYLEISGIDKIIDKNTLSISTLESKLPVQVRLIHLSGTFEDFYLNKSKKVSAKRPRIEIKEPNYVS